MEEILDLVDENDRIIGNAPRSDCHGDPRCMHRAVHLFVLNRQREIYLQKRSGDKRVQPGKWDTSVGGHIATGEKTVDALFREAYEELGLNGFSPTFMYRYIMRNDFESELINTFVCIWDKELTPDPQEISYGCFWREEEIVAALGGCTFTPNFEDEFQRFTDWRRRYPRRYTALYEGDGPNGAD